MHSRRKTGVVSLHIEYGAWSTIEQIRQSMDHESWYLESWYLENEFMKFVEV